MPSALSPTGHVRLYSHEQGDVTFSEPMTVHITRRDSLHPIDPQFLDVCDARSWFKVFSGADQPIAIGAKVLGTMVRVRLSRKPKTPVQVDLLVMAIRRGFVGWRFKPATVEEFDANEAFWARSQPGGGT